MDKQNYQRFLCVELHWCPVATTKFLSPKESSVIDINAEKVKLQQTLLVTSNFICIFFLNS